MGDTEDTTGVNNIENPFRPLFITAVKTHKSAPVKSSHSTFVTSNDNNAMAFIPLRKQAKIGGNINKSYPDDHFTVQNNLTTTSRLKPLD